MTKFEAGRMLYIGVGGDVEGLVSPDLVVTPGTIVRAILVDDDGISHNLYFPDFEAQSATIGRKGQTTEVTFTIPGDYPAGAYVYYCTRPGHRQAGQEGRLIVKQAE
jgi:nitrite reductase (NO-forming)